MAITETDIQRLGPEARKQIIRKLGKGREPKERKMHERKTDVRMQDGRVRSFDSQREADRFRELELLQRCGEISDLRCQVRFELIPAQVRPDGKKEQPCYYIADFVYRDGKDIVVEDAKGCRDTGSAVYKLFTVKRKLMLQVHLMPVHLSVRMLPMKMSLRLQALRQEFSSSFFTLRNFLKRFTHDFQALTLRQSYMNNRMLCLFLI